MNALFIKMYAIHGSKIQTNQNNQNNNQNNQTNQNNQNQITVLTDDQIIEGVIASITFTLLLIYFKEKEGYILGGIMAWFTTWVFRKFSVNLYEYLKKKGYAFLPRQITIPI